jgi:signal transduction histidine kinase
MKKWVVSILLTISFLVASGQYNPEEYNIDSLNNVLRQTRIDSIKYFTHIQLGLAYQPVNADSAVFHFSHALKLAKLLQSVDKEMNCNIILGLFYSQIGQSLNAINLLHKVLRYAEETNTDPTMALAFLSYNYEAIGDMQNALEYQRRSFLMYEQMYKSKYPGLDQRGYVAGPMRAGIVFEKMNQLDSALFYARLAFDRIQTEPPQPYFYSQICILLGKVYMRLEQREDAARFFRLALNKAVEVNFLVPIQESQLGLAHFFHDSNQTDSAIYYATRAYEGATGIKGYAVMTDAAGLLRILFEKRGNFNRALYFNDLAIAARDSVTGVEKIREVQNLTNREERRQQKMKEDVEAERIAYTNRVKIYSLMAVIVGALLIAVILYRNNRQKQKANIQLQEQKDEVHKALTDLKSTQAQLIQSEKMASLGELTSGIAHEIQNPLNFVNNFSELSGELIDEMKMEIANGNTEDVAAIAEDLKQNLAKINHHGKRADAIVKGMLQHSRRSSGTREPTDLNDMVEEWFRLAFHGFKSKDENFTVSLSTDFDAAIGQVNIIPQEVGRVLLNLYNNAFYAVDEKKKMSETSYEPSIRVSTHLFSGTVNPVSRQSADSIIISIKDNGNGIPEKVVDKIFNPFFTTKPTGQGTGLGLSLSYDIIKGHGGEIKVISQPGEGTEFVISLPMQE